MTYRVPFNASQSTGPVSIVNGVPVITDDMSGAQVPIYEQDALHANPFFADVTAGEPDNWNAGLEVDGTGMAADSGTGMFGTDAVLLGVNASGGAFQTILSDPFTVDPGNKIKVGAWAGIDTGDPTLQLGLLTDPTSPGFLTATTFDQRTDREALTADPAQFAKEFTVPLGHTSARLFAVVDSLSSSAASARISYTTSKRTGSAVVATPWTALPYATNWADAGFGWQAGQYRRLDDILELRGLCARSTSASGATATIATLPAGFRPVANNGIGDAYYPAAGGAAATQVYVTAAGLIVTSVSVPAGDFVRFNARVSLT